jgi:hypothetical protein
MAYAIGIDNIGQAVIAGYTLSNDIPEKSPIQARQPNQEVYLAILGTAGNSLRFGSYLGGDGDEISNALSVYGGNTAFITGYTFSTDFPTVDPYQTDLDNADAFVISLAYESYVCGDIDGQEGIGILDIVFLINFKYKDGPAPDPLEAADVNAGMIPDGQINILDIVYLINFLYKDGPDPDCP